jgi:Cu(I)/Ag(I) efflux system membrane fusion protein
LARGAGPAQTPPPAGGGGPPPQAAAGVADSAPQAARGHLASIAERAAKLGDGGDIEAARVAFGEVSKPVVALVDSVADARQRYHEFECPMAKGYNRWVQRDAKMANPYMGTAMLECGSEVEP